MQAAGTQGARKEYNWTQLSPEKKELWKAAAINGWSVYVENQAIEVLHFNNLNRFATILLDGVNWIEFFSHFSA